ncbi:protein mono-ADP-ribosyltransferase PARP15-like [Mixophyes fleayi]|uniref:protein mono-ADP-ribosyltransferase PARP15-like n=1 Tax=Mixophyes fleayi TaxID=3061075 RepID=UPI003F4D8601
MEQPLELDFGPSPAKVKVTTATDPAIEEPGTGGTPAERESQDKRLPCRDHSTPSWAASREPHEVLLEPLEPGTETEGEGKLPKDGFVITSAGQLKCRKIIHLINVTPKVIVESLKKALKACDQHDLKTVSLPAIGTGASNIDPKSSIKLIMKGIEEYIFDPTTENFISEINIVVSDLYVYHVYANFWQDYEKTFHHFTAFGKTIELIKGDITDQTVDCIVNLANSTLNQSTGVSGSILAAAGKTVKKECKKIGVLLNDGIAITSGGNTKSKKIMHIIGTASVVGYEPLMDRILLGCHNNGITSVALPAIGTGISRIDPEESIKAILSSILCYLSETPLPTLATITIVVIQENIYKTYLKVFQEKCTEIQIIVKCNIFHVSTPAKTVKIEYPKTWTNIGEMDLQEVTLKIDSQEYKDVATKFITSAAPSSLKLVEIKRIQNRKLWQSFSINTQEVDRKNPGKQNIQYLYHGTTSGAIMPINQGGFNRIYYGKNGSACGTGTYFSVDSNFACGNRYAVPDHTGNKYVYQAAVITGRYCQGKREYKEPPYINNDPSGDRYDSVVGTCGKTTYFVVYHDDYAYPEYVITFNSYIA